MLVGICIGHLLLYLGLFWSLRYSELIKMQYFIKKLEKGIIGIDFALDYLAELEH